MAPGVFGNIGVHGMNETNVVHTFCRVRKNVAHPFTALAILTKTKGRWEQPILRVPQRLAVHGLRPLSGMFGDHRLVIKGVDL